MKIDCNNRILITGMRAPAALELSRLFNSKNHVVIGVDSCRFPLGRFSNSVSKYYRVSAPRVDHNIYVQELIEIIINENIDLLIPTCEEVFYISRHKKLIEKHCRISCCEFDLISKLHHKYEFSKLTNNFAIKSPKGELIDNEEALNNIDDRNIVLKPAYSRFASKALIKPTKKEIQNIAPTILNPWIKQQYIEGDEYCVYAIANHGNLTAISCYKPNYRAGQGASIYFKSEDTSKLEQFVTEFIQKHQCHGQISFDFIKDNIGQFYAIECNPRATSGIHLFDDHDEIPRAFSNSKKSVTKPASDVCKMVGLAMVIYSLKESIKGGAFSNWRTDTKKAKDVVLNGEDIYPFFGQFLSLIEYTLVAARNLSSLLSASTHDIEWNGEELK